MAIDLLLVAVLIQLGGVVLGFTAAFVLWRMSGRGSGGGVVKRGLRTSLRVAAAILVFIVVGRYSMDLFRNNDDDDQAQAEEAAESAQVNTENGASSRDITARLADSVALAYTAALERRDTTVADSLLVVLRRSLAGSGPTEQERTNARLSAEVARLSRQLERAQRGRGLRSFVSATADDLGLGFGWMALYFTAFLALWQGQTPGKRLLKIRVVRLDNKPVTWWIAFERFGGYAASATLGLLGFLQILWDRNRQGLHDKAAETLVIRTS